MRIIAGSLGGRRFFSPPGINTRPTSDKVREALFNILFTKTQDARVLDGFAGSGALSFEALSRGAAHCTLVEQNRAAIASIKKSITQLELEAQTTLISGDFFRQAAWLSGPFDIIFFDPPYAAGLLGQALEVVKGCALLAPKGIIVYEYARGASLGDIPATFRLEDTRRYGDTCLNIYVKDDAT